MTRQQNRCLDAIRRLSVGGCVPSYAEIAADMGRTQVAVHFLIHRLAAQGVIAMAPGEKRSVRIVGDLKGELNRLVAVHGEKRVRTDLEAVIRPAITKEGWQCGDSSA